MDPQDDFKKGLGAVWYILEEVKAEVKSLSSKWDKVITLEVKIESLTNSVDSLQRVLTTGNGQKSVVVQLEELRTRVAGVETQSKSTGAAPAVSTVDPAIVRKEKLANWGKVLGIFSLVLSNVFTWIFLGAGK